MKSKLNKMHRSATCMDFHMEKTIELCKNRKNYNYSSDTDIPSKPLDKTEWNRVMSTKKRTSSQKKKSKKPLEVHIIIKEPSTESLIEPMTEQITKNLKLNNNEPMTEPVESCIYKPVTQGVSFDTAKSILALREGGTNSYDNLIIFHFLFGKVSMNIYVFL